MWRPLENWLARQTQGKVYGSGITKLVPLNFQYPSNSPRLVKRHGLQFHLNLRDLVDWGLFFGFTEKGKSTYYNHLQPGMTVVDVGANMGETALMASRLVGETGKVFAFEPDPFNYQRLSTNANANKLPQLSLHNAGCGPEKGTLKIEVVAENNRGMNRIAADQSTSKGQEVAIVLLDEVLQEKVDAVKIDTEGFEIKVIEGAERILKQDKPFWFVELDDELLKAQGGSAQKLVTIFTENGYKVSRPETGEKIDPSYDFTHCHFDILAMPKH